MPFPPEMNAFQVEVGSDQRLMASRDLQDGAIVSDTGRYASSSGGPTPDA
jgi:hypothetical protein